MCQGINLWSHNMAHTYGDAINLHEDLDKNTVFILKR